MSSTRIDVLLWAKRIAAKRTGEPHQLLEIAADATLDQAQEAFHKVAKIGHPDLHRTTLTGADLELVTQAYALVANAYHQFRTNKTPTTKMATVKPAPDAPRRRSNSVSLPGGGVINVRGSTTRPPINTTSTPATSSTKLPVVMPEAPPPPPQTAPTNAPVSAASQMNGKAIVHFRKAELALRQGDVRNGLLQLKMAIAADPQSAFLRTALTEVEAEIGKKP